MRLLDPITMQLLGLLKTPEITERKWAKRGEGNLYTREYNQWRFNFRTSFRIWNLCRSGEEPFFPLKP